jgi:tetratricopeptide (TPR) repeat protein
LRIGLFNESIELKCHPPKKEEASMSETKSNALPERNACSYTAASEFERAVNKAHDLLEKSDLDGALKILSVLESGYINCTKLFDLMGDTLLKKGDLKEGIRYKTLHEVLKGTFKIVTEHAERRTEDRPAVIEKDTPTSSEAAAAEPEFPVTAAMAQELMRQGHYDRAARVFARLLEMHPEDRLLREAGEKARRKYGEKELVGILQKWLSNIDRIKLDKSGGI